MYRPHEQATCTGHMYRPHVQASCTGLVYRPHVQATCTGRMYRSRVQASCTGHMYRPHVQVWGGSRWHDASESYGQVCDIKVRLCTTMHTVPLGWHDQGQTLYHNANWYDAGSQFDHETCSRSACDGLHKLVVWHDRLGVTRASPQPTKGRARPELASPWPYPSPNT